MKNKYNKRKYKMQFGVQRVEMDTPDYGSAYAIRQKQNATSQMTGNLISGALNMAVPGAGSAVQGLSAISDAAFKDAKGNYKNKFSEIASAYTNPLATAGKAVSALTGDKAAAAHLFNVMPITAGLQALGVKNPFGKTTQEKVKEEAMKQEDITKMANINKRYSEATATDAQSFLAKRGKYKVKSKQPRLIETEGREPIFSPKKADGTRDLLYYNPNDPTHEEGGVKAVVMPRNKYNSGVSNLMPKRSKVSLLGSGNMAVGAKQVKVKELNDTSLSQNLGGMPAVNAANKFIQPMAGKMQVARQIPEYRRKEKQNTPRSHRKENPDTNRIIDPPMLYEMKPPPPRSTFNTKNDFQDGVNKLEGDIISKVVMNRNKDKDFVKRTKATNMFKTWDDFDTKATHKMAHGEDDRGQSYMYPTIMNPKNEAIKVPNQYADYISSEGYKKATGMNKGSKKIKVYR